MYLKIYKAFKHTVVRTVLSAYACLQRSATGQVICPAGNSWRTVRRPESGGNPADPSAWEHNASDHKMSWNPIAEALRWSLASSLEAWAQPSLEKPGISRLGQCLSRRLRVEETFPLGRFLPPYAILFCFELLLDVFLRNFFSSDVSKKLQR